MKTDYSLIDIAHSDSFNAFIALVMTLLSSIFFVCWLQVPVKTYNNLSICRSVASIVSHVLRSLHETWTVILYLNRCDQFHLHEQRPPFTRNDTITHVSVLSIISRDLGLQT